MKIYAICVMKNEADIIQYSLREAAKWADKVIVFDNGSSDGTWEKVKAIQSEKIIPFKQDSVPYSDGLRTDVFDAFKNELEDNDWWVVQDADELFDQNPRTFIENQKGYFHHINGKKIDFCFDLNKLNEIHFANDFASDLALFDHYTPVAWSEPRAIKHRKRMEWKREGIWPAHMGLVCETAIHIRHYPLRSRDQIKKRWDTRKDVREKGGQLFSHWEKGNWEEYYLNKAKEQKKITGAENVFEKVPFANEYRQSFIKRFAKTLLHRSGILPGFIF